MRDKFGKIVLADDIVVYEPHYEGFAWGDPIEGHIRIVQGIRDNVDRVIIDGIEIIDFKEKYLKKA